MVPVLPIVAGGVIALLAILLSKKDAKASTSKSSTITEPNGPGAEDVSSVEKELSPAVKEELQAFESEQDPERLKAAAAIAASEGKAEQATAINKVYDSARIEQGTVTYVSPIANLKGENWTKFVNALKGTNSKLITPGFALGLWGFGARRLVDLGLMKNPRQGTYKGKTVWTGDWTPPLDINKFLADSSIQYKALFASLRDYATKVQSSPQIRALIGKNINGKVVTLSGILGVAHKAGWSGMQKWFADPNDRIKFAATTQAFNATNGIF